MDEAQARLIELIEDVENFGNRFMFLVNAASVDSQLSERARIGFLEYGVESVKQFNAIEEKLKSYRENCIPN
ncbi:hypothetical protein JM49_28665 [Pseudomonas chlororaphis subsp. aurantiaca]|uniref:hypothetical protein n=1 Tax=Pseudomonas chlororaphis TaxID=587753 RepID=UPI00050D5B7B|nr:hypothetical protein [Pseudomonas chlororaphis]AIS15509.1 hypothetical protein JM49_28665 [Pseudomonas chlororaphis subsp. aurantiaca]